MKSIAYLTYLIYIIFWEGMIFGGTGYAIFVLDHNWLWIIVAVYIGFCAYSPMKWIHGKDETFVDSLRKRKITDE